MAKKFKVKVDDSFVFDITDEEISSLDTVKVNDSKYHVLQNNKSFNAELICSNFNKKNYAIKINNNSFNVDISNPLDFLIEQLGFNIGSTKHVNSIKAPMPGLILDIMVKKGQEVCENQGLLILEAMKMENIITSPRDGKIKSVSVSKGDAIDKDYLLIEFE